MDVTDPHNRNSRFDCSRVGGIAFGLGTQLLFAFTVWHLFFFLRDGGSQSGNSYLPIDTLLTLQFAVIHSTLLYPTVRRRLQRWISPAFYGCFFCFVTCLSLLITIAFWRTGTGFRADADGWFAAAISAAFYASWIALFYSLWLSGLGYQTGWTPFWYWLRRVPPAGRAFRERGAYRIFRHPIYLSFLGLIWFTPHLTSDRLLLMAVWTTYIAVGSHLKDERLAFFLGRTYREYQERVPGYPFVCFGPLGRRKPDPDVIPAVFPRPDEPGDSERRAG